MAINVYVSINYESLLMLTHYLRHLNYTIKSILRWKWWTLSLYFESEGFFCKTKWENPLYVLPRANWNFVRFDHRDTMVMKDPDDSPVHHKAIERLKVHIFLVRFDEDFDSIQWEILHKDLVPNLDECYSLVWREVVCNSTLKGYYGTFESSTMITQNKPNSGQKNRVWSNKGIPTNGIGKSSYKCTYYN